MRLVARKERFVRVLLGLILSGGFFTGVVFADDELKTVPAGDEQPKKLGNAKTETVGQSDSAARGDICATGGETPRSSGTA